MADARGVAAADAGVAVLVVALEAPGEAVRAVAWEVLREEGAHPADRSLLAAPPAAEAAWAAEWVVARVEWAVAVWVEVWVVVVEA